MPDDPKTPPAPATPAGGDTQDKIYPPAEPAKDPGTTVPNPDPAKPGDGPKDPGAKPPDGTARVVPDVYDLKLPDGSLLDAKAKEGLASFAKEKKLTQDEAQALLERENSLLTSYVDSKKEELKQQQQEWIKQIETDKEIGGENVKRNIEMAHRILNRYGDDELKKILNDPTIGYGNYPPLVRIFVRIGKAMSEDQLVLPGTQSTGKKSLEEIFYPDPTKV